MSLKKKICKQLLYQSMDNDILLAVYAEAYARKEYLLRMNRNPDISESIEDIELSRRELLGRLNYIPNRNRSPIT